MLQVPATILDNNCGTSHATLSKTNTVSMHPGVGEGQRHAQHSHCTRMFGEAPSFGIHALLHGKEPTGHTHVVVYPERTRPLSVLRCVTVIQLLILVRHATREKTPKPSSNTDLPELYHSTPAASIRDQETA